MTTRRRSRPAGSAPRGANITPTRRSAFPSLCVPDRTPYAVAQHGPRRSRTEVLGTGTAVWPRMGELSLACHYGTLPACHTGVRPVSLILHGCDKTGRTPTATRICTLRLPTAAGNTQGFSSSQAAQIMRRVQRGHNRSFQPYSPMGWRVARSGRVHKLCQRLRSSGSRYARHRSHIRQLRRARIRHGPGRASGRANWCGDGPGRPRPTRGRHTRRPGGRVVCTGIGNPGSNVFPASRPVCQWGGTRQNIYLAVRRM